MSYRIKEIFYTIQGEGLLTGTPAVFVRFGGCNLWTGREEDRHKGPSCSRWCDTDFVGGTEMTADEVVAAASGLYPEKGGKFGLVVYTGGEPMLQADPDLSFALYRAGFLIQIETNGTIPVPPAIAGHVTVSPKLGTKLRQRHGTELKLVYPHGLDPAEFERLHFSHLFLQPLDDENREENTRRCVEYVKAHPQWRLSVQTHKLIGVP